MELLHWIILSPFAEKRPSAMPSNLLQERDSRRGTLARQSLPKPRRAVAGALVSFSQCNKLSRPSWAH